MPRTSEMLPPSKYISKADVGDREFTVTIAGVQNEQVGPRPDDTKWCIYFREAQKGMTLNAGSIRALEAVFGQDSDQWIGQQVVLWVDWSVKFGSQTVGGLRLRPVRAAAPAAAGPGPGARRAAVFSAPAAAPARPAAPSPPVGISAGRMAAPAGRDPDDDIPF
jgi:hypothetical protein